MLLRGYIAKLSSLALSLAIRVQRRVGGRRKRQNDSLLSLGLMSWD